MDLYSPITALQGIGPARAKQLADIITALVSDEEKLFGFLRDHADDVEWD